MDKITEYLRYRKVPAFFQRVVIDYYQHLMSSSRSNTVEEEVIAGACGTVYARARVCVCVCCNVCCAMCNVACDKETTKHIAQDFSYVNAPSSSGHGGASRDTPGAPFPHAQAGTNATGPFLQ